MNALELKIPPVALVLITGSLMWALACIAPTASFAFPAPLLAAILLAAAGAGIAIAGVLKFRSAGTTVDPRVPDQSARLVVRGVYRFSRNPMYVGLLLVLCAWGIILGNLPALVMLPAFVIYMNRFQILPEERHLKEKFGEAFQQYTQRVRRWI